MSNSCMSHSSKSSSSEPQQISIRSHKGVYTAIFREDALEHLVSQVASGRHEQSHFIIDSNVATLYEQVLSPILELPNKLIIEASERNKSLDRIPEYIERLAETGIRKGHSLVAIGGGITQDITCFLAATVMRGLPWSFYPTTLLAQADSCIGSKSSINVGSLKNFVGTFTPPESIFVTTRVLKTLPSQEILSGVGEMIKVHVIDGPSSFDQLAKDYEQLFTDDKILAHYILRSLEIKKGLIEIDEFDQNVRKVMNYGHTFGHAIESATDYSIPHGIAVTIGMDMANFVAMKLEVSSESHFSRMHPTMVKNFGGYQATPIPFEPFFGAMKKDKKNVGALLTLILPDREGRVNVGQYAGDDAFQALCRSYFERLSSGDLA